MYRQFEHFQSQKLSDYISPAQNYFLILSKQKYSEHDKFMDYNSRIFHRISHFINQTFLIYNNHYRKIFKTVLKDLQYINLDNKFFQGNKILESLINYEVIPNIKDEVDKYLCALYQEKIRKLSILENQCMFHFLLKSILFNKIDKILSLSNKLMKNNLSEKIVFIKKGKEIIGKKIIRSSDLIPYHYKSNKDNWVPVWHGTHYESLESIMKLGLKLPGTKLEDGTVIKPLSWHIGRNITIDNIDDWAKGIFVSQSIFYAANNAYGKEIEANNKDWIVLVEGRARIGSYYARRHTFGNVNNYTLLEGEPEDVEFRIEKESDIIVVSILFVNKEYIKQIKEYKEGALFANNSFGEKNESQYEVKQKKGIKEKEKSKFYEYNDIFQNYECDELYESDDEKKKEKEEIFIDSIKYRINYFQNKNIYIDSKILKGDIVFQQKLIQWLKNPNISLKSQNLEYIKLLYRGSRDGFKSQAFHDNCDNQGPTLVIIESSDNYIFGGYSSIDWQSTTWNGKCGKDNNARRAGKGYEFVFTLKNPHDIPPLKFNIKKNWLDHSICCDINLGPIFGCNDIRIQNNCDQENNYFTYYDFTPGEFCFDDTTGKKRLLFTGNSTYKVKEIEVFKIFISSEEINNNFKQNYTDYNFYNKKFNYFI